jgi:hypothetical protein
MADHATTDESYQRLHMAGWSIGSTAQHTTGNRVVWLVTGSNGENRLRAEGETEVEAWHRAVEQARELGMLGRGD